MAATTPMADSTEAVMASKSGDAVSRVAVSRGTVLRVAVSRVAVSRVAVSRVAVSREPCCREPCCERVVVAWSCCNRAGGETNARSPQKCSQARMPNKPQWRNESMCITLLTTYVHRKNARAV